jgi:hypothetical protein
MHGSCPFDALLAVHQHPYLRTASGDVVMIEMLYLYQLARHPLQAFTRRLVCQGITLATGRTCRERDSFKDDVD